MLGAMKVLVPLGVGLAGLVAFASKANAKPGSAATGPGVAKTEALTTVQVADMMTKALASADPKVLLELADKLEKQGFKQQAADLRSVAAQLSKVGAAAAGTTPPPFVPSGPVTPAANIPTASPSSPNVLTPPPIQLPNMVVTAPAPAPTQSVGPSSAERDVAAQVVIDQQSKPKWRDNRDLVSVFQTQEARAGSYKNIVTGEPGKVDGLYGPGTAIALAERYGMVPPPPKYWPKNPQPALTAYKSRLSKLAAADPVRASEWNQAAQKAKVT